MKKIKKTNVFNQVEAYKCECECKCNCQCYKISSTSGNKSDGVSNTKNSEHDTVK